jgi:dTDP-4-amino-4,6-dideoxygalactose transaminase
VRGAVVRAVERLGLDGHEMLVPAYHHGVEVEALVAAGVRPRFYNVRRDFQADLQSLASEVTPKTRALYVIHYAGFPQPFTDLLAFARAHRLRVIEDCALSLLSSDGPRPLGSRGDAAVFCLYKTLPVPNGGALWMPEPGPEPELHPAGGSTAAHQVVSSLLVRFERDAGIVGQAARTVVQQAARLVRTWRPLPVDARPVGGRRFLPGQEKIAISPVSLQVARRLDARRIVEIRRRNYYALMSRLLDVATPMVHELAPGVSPLFYPLWSEDKQRLQANLADEDIETIDFWRHGSPLVPVGKFPDVEAMRAHVLELPIHQDLDAADIERLARAVRRILETKTPRLMVAAGE